MQIIGDNTQYIYCLLPIHCSSDSNLTERYIGKIHHLNTVTMKRTVLHCVGAAKTADNLNKYLKQCSNGAEVLAI